MLETGGQPVARTTKRHNFEPLIRRPQRRNEG
jgi:hypothetical protein